MQEPNLFQKEVCINRLANTYREVFECDVISAMNNMRANYSASELQ